MSYITEKFNLTEQQEKDLIKEGLLCTTINVYHEIHKYYQDLLKNKSLNAKYPKMNAAHETSEHFKISIQTVYRALKVFKK